MTVRRNRGTGRPSGIRGVPVSPRGTFFMPGTSTESIRDFAVGATRSSISSTGISTVDRFPCFRASTRRKAFVTVTRSNWFLRRSRLSSDDTTGAAMRKRPTKPRKK